ncbi:MAG: hypothetical protein BroJett030_07140 [Alphaproteobacteria bacterium]|nr:MAG: hypothetical protein BroJett030_07140 [Alphaproteobacteria bacterium]
MNHVPSPARRARFAGLLLAAALPACQVGGSSRVLALKGEAAPTEIILAVARAAQTCWFKSADSAFAAYRLADEVNSPAGRPRVLLVPRRDPSALPVLVIQAETKGTTASGTFSDIQAYGPLLSSAHGERIAGDVRRWASGDNACA